MSVYMYNSYKVTNGMSKSINVSSLFWALAVFHIGSVWPHDSQVCCDTILMIFWASGALPPCVVPGLLGFAIFYNILLNKAHTDALFTFKFRIAEIYFRPPEIYFFSDLGQVQFHTSLIECAKIFTDNWRFSIEFSSLIIRTSRKIYSRRI